MNHPTFNMRKWQNKLINSNLKKALPIMTYPGLKYTGESVFDIVTKAESQYRCINALANNFSSIAEVMIMDLSVEAEAFGVKIKFHKDEMPDVIAPIVFDAESISNLQIPKIKGTRAEEFIKVAGLLHANSKNNPVFGGMVGPYSLSVRLFNMTDFMMHTLMEPDSAKLLISKATEFLVEFAKAYKNAGANGIIIAEPAAGLLSPMECDEFSSNFVKSIIESVQDENFTVILHNCGNTEVLVDSMLSTRAKGLHFGNSVDMLKILKQVPQDILVLGNLDPVSIFKLGNPDLIREKTLDLLKKTKAYDNFVISSGCDIPPLTSVKNISAFFSAIEEFNTF